MEQRGRTMKLRMLCIVINGLIFSITGYTASYSTNQTISSGNYADPTINISNGAVVNITGNGAINITNNDVSNSGARDTILVNNGSIDLGKGSSVGANITATAPQMFDNRADGIYVLNTTPGAISGVTADDLSINMDASNNAVRTAATYGIYSDRNAAGSTINYDLNGTTTININNVNNYTGNSGQLNGIGLTNGASSSTNFVAEELNINIDDNHASGNYIGMKFKNSTNSSVPNTSLNANYTNTNIEINAQNTIINSLGIFVRNAEVISSGNTNIIFNSQGNMGVSTNTGINDDPGVHGIKVNNRGSFTGNDIAIDLTATDDIGNGTRNVNAIHLDNSSELINQNNITIDISAGGYANSVDGISVNGGSNFENKQDIAINLDGTAGILGNGINVAGNDSQFIVNANPTTSDIKIVFGSNTSTGIADIKGINVTASSSGVKNIDADLASLIITTHGANDTGAYIFTSNGLSEITTKNIQLGSIGVDNDVLAINAMGGELNLNATNSTYIKGNIVATNGGRVNANFQNGLLQGAASNSNGTSHIGLTLANNMTWNMTDSSRITDLDISNSRVNFIPTTNSVLTTNTLHSTAGAGSFKMHVDMGAQTGDRIIIGDATAPGSSGLSSGAYSLVLTNNGVAQTNGSELYDVVLDYTPTANANATFTSNTVEQGGYEYGLRTITTGAPTKTHQLYATGRRSSSADAAISFLNTNYLLSYIEMQTLFQRMGELRSKQGQEGDFWLRSYAGKLNSFSNSHGLRGFHMNYTGVQAGIDKLIKANSGDIYFGLMAGYTDADPRYRNGGSGGVRGINFGLYGTYIHDSGFYLDAVAKYHRMKNNFSVKDTLGQSVKGKSKSDGYSLSLETGKRFYIKQSAFYIEPQAQIVYAHQQGDTVNASNGLKVKLGSYNSLLGSARMAFGYNLVEGDNPINLQLKSGYVREFQGSTSYHLNTAKEKYNFRGGWIETSLGISGEINKNHNLYGEISYANGSRFDKRQINLGYRYQF